jgi:hypothetical protein
LPSAPLKSMMTSKRSATPIVRSFSRTGAGKNPPSVPIWLNAGPGRPFGVPSARLVEGQVVEPRVRGVQDAEAILAWLDLQERPHLAVDQHRVAEELGNPHGWHARIRVAAIVLHRIEQRAVRVEEPVLDHQRDLERAVGKIEVVLDAVTEQIDARQPGEVVQPGRAQRVVVVPELRRGLIIRIVVGPPLEEGPGPREIVREPRLGIAVALRQNFMSMQVDDRPHLRLSRLVAVQRVVDRQHMAIRQVVHPAHGYRLASTRLERGAGILAVVAPERGRR